MKCPKCGVELDSKTTICPFCKTELDNKDEFTRMQNEGVYSKLDPNKESYDFDIQYTLTFKESEEVRQAAEVADRKMALEDDPEVAAYRQAAERAAQRNSKRKHHSARKAPAQIENKNDDSKKKISRGKNKRARRIFFVGIALVLVISLIIGVISMISSILNKPVEVPTVYLKDNSAFMTTGGKPVQITDSFVLNEEAPAKEEVSEKDEKSDKDEKKTSDKKSDKEDKKTEESKETAFSKKDLLQYSKDGKNMYFFENFDMIDYSGDLVYIPENDVKKKVKIASNIFYKFLISEDGKSVMFLSGANSDGTDGQLCYWNANEKKVEILAASVSDGFYSFSADSSTALYVTEYNPEYYVGNLYSKTVGKKIGESKMLDSDVSMLFGANFDGSVAIYGKSYHKDTEIFDVYSIKPNDDMPTLIAGSTKLAPVILKANNSIYAYEAEKDGFHNLVFINLASNAKKKLADGITEITNISTDELSVVYTKAYDNDGKKIIDYYYVNSAEANSQKIANNVGVFLDDQHARIVQFAISDDLSTVAYIAGFDTNSEHGTLYTASVMNGFVGGEKQISNTAYSCHVSTDGSVIRYAANYDKDSNSVELLSYIGGETKSLATGVGSSSFTFDKLGLDTVYATNFDFTTQTGKLFGVNQKGKTRKIQEDVNAYGLKANGNTIFFKNMSIEGDKFDLYNVKAESSKVKEIDTDVNMVLKY